MALQIDITDSKGVKTRYHAIRSFCLQENGKLLVTLYGYVNQKTRQEELEAKETNKRALEYDKMLQEKQAELDSLLANQTMNDGARIAELTDEINRLTFAEDRPQYKPDVDTHYSEDTVAVDFKEPLTISGLYDQISQLDKYKNATKI